MAKLTNAMIEAAIYGFEARKKDIDVQIAELRAMMPGAPASGEETPAKARGRLKGRKLSAAVRAKMRKAQQLRWAKVQGKPSVAASKAPARTAVKAAKPKGGITAEGRKALSIAMKKRWAAKKAA